MPRAPDEGGTAFGGYGQGGFALTAEETPWWQPCPQGYVRSKIPPHECVAEHYYGADTRTDMISIFAGLLFGGLFLIAVVEHFGMKDAKKRNMEEEK